MCMTISLTHYHRLGRPGVDIHCSHGSEVAVIQILFLINEVTPPNTPPTKSPPFQNTHIHQKMAKEPKPTCLIANLFSTYTMKSEFLNSVSNILCKCGYTFIFFLTFNVSNNLLIILNVLYICSTCELLNMIHVWYYNYIHYILPINYVDI